MKSEKSYQIEQLQKHGARRCKYHKQRILLSLQSIIKPIRRKTVAEHFA